MGAAGEGNSSGGCEFTGENTLGRKPCVLTGMAGCVRGCGPHVDQKARARFLFKLLLLAAAA